MKICDLGISAEVEDSKDDDDFYCTIGTFRYMSPEQLENKLTLKSDIWAFGCVLLELATGLKPYCEIEDSIH